MTPEERDDWYGCLTPAEKRIIAMWEADGLSREEALLKLQDELDDAAEEDGF